MGWLKRNLWKAGIAIVGMLLLLMLTVWLPVSVASAYEVMSRLAGPVAVTMQATPTVDATVSALSKEQLTLQVKQLQNQNNWLSNNATALIAAVTAIVVAFIGFTQWTGTARQARDKDLKDKAEARFQAAVTGLGDEKEGAKIGAAILLRTFLRPGHEQFYTQTFDLAVANLRLPRIPHVSEDPDGIPHSPENPNTPLPLTTLSQALIVVFKEAFPLARNTIIGDKKGALQSLDATNIQLDNAYLVEADLKQVWIEQAFLRQAYLEGANLAGANLHHANLAGADLIVADLTGADLINANLSSADLRRANLSSADLIGTNLSEANLSEANLSEATLFHANLSGANLSEAVLDGVHKLKEVLSLKDTDLRGVKGLTKEQLAICKAMGAIIDE